MRRVKLRDICSNVDYGLTASSTQDDTGLKFLRITDIDGDVIDWDGVPFVAATPKEAASNMLRSGDVVVARTGASVGRSAWVRPPKPTVFASYLVRLRADPSFLDSRFLGLLLKGASWRNHVSSIAHGKSAQPNMSASAMGEFTVDLPEPDVQRAIAEVLGALDEKIAANTTVVDVLDRLRGATYGALLGCRSCRSEPLSSLAQFVNGRAYTKNATGTGRVVIRIAELNSGLGGSTVYNEIEVPHDNLARPGDLLFAWSGSLTAARWYRPDAIVNQHIFKVIPNVGWPMWLVACAVDRKLDDFKAIAADKATTMGHIQRHHLDELVGVPSQVDIEANDAAMSTLWDRALAGEVESLRLADLRDMLLPHLLSGRITVREAEKAVEEVL